MKYYFFNSGNYYVFNANDKVYPPNNRPVMTSLDFHNELAAQFNRPDTFVVEAKDAFPKILKKGKKK